ncbi:GntR family transcriptional regulator [Pedobacter sp. SYSU D00535]|uniref:GntR family transcriptional regulator n=1 Tax=Pedobacter sp. SYSU D00535 TaxID=2810308 RepID=UPI001A96D567|nr:GntR family transcriptional regulator [Pedobacter sp. SYSU D00535]
MNAVRLDSNSEIPLYEQLAEQIRSAIKKDKYGDLSPLPSPKHLSRTLMVSKVTAYRAYWHLAKLGCVEWIKGKGFFVTMKKGC